MKIFCLSLGLATLAALAPPSLAATNVGVSIGIDQPGFYGRVDIGRVAAPPVLMYPQPMVIVPSPVVQYQSPIYLYVPPGHAQNWHRHCGRYGACNRPVYFVGEGWYRDHYRGHHGGHYRGHYKGDNVGYYNGHHKNGKHGDRD